MLKTIFLLLIQQILAGKYGLSFHLLKNIRSNITFLPYTPDQRVQVAQGAQALLGVYVNRLEKMDYFKDEFPDIDPIPRMNAIAKDAATMEDEAFHKAMSDLFLSLRDMHTNYHLPGPHACFFPVLPMTFDFVNSMNFDLFPVLVISGFTGFSEILEKAGMDAEKMKLGDILVRVNGLTFLQFYEKYKWLANGSNKDANMRAVASLMTSRGGLLQLMPEEDEMVFEFFSRETMNPYTVKLNWIAIRNDECYAETMQEYSKLTGVPMPHIPKVSHLAADSKLMNAFKPIKTSLKSKLMMSVPFPHLKETIYPKRLDMGIQYLPTDDSCISWTIYQNGDFRLGIIRLLSFVPDSHDAMNVVNIIRNLLVNELSETDGLIFDVRSNGGGLITMADGIPQLFVKDFVQPGFRALVSPINGRIFSNSKFWPEGDRFAMAYGIVSDGDVYTAPVQMEFSEEVNRLGTAYTKPVGVLTNAECYSACDCFSANMQDSGAAIIFGEDKTTGAGGANVLEYNYLKNMDEVDFPDLPFHDLEHGSANFRVGWRQQVRNGKNAGKIIEDYGILSDFITRPHTVDITSTKFRNSSTQFDRIVKILRGFGRKTKRDATYFKSEPIDLEQEINRPVSFNITFSGLTKLVLLDEKKNILNEVKLSPNYKDRYNVALNSRDIHTTTGISTFTIQGYRDSSLIVHTHRYVRFLPAKVDYYELGAYSNLNWDFSPAPHVAIYNENTPPELGWNYDSSSDQMVIGNGIEYANNIHTQLSVFVKSNPDLGRPPMLSLVADYDTEEGCDFLHVGYKSANDSDITLALVSGTGSLNLEESLGEMGDTTEIFFSFKSDPAVVAKGVNITNLMVVG